MHCEVCVCGLGPLQQIKAGPLPGGSGRQVCQNTGVGLQVLQDVVARGACRAGGSRCLSLLPAMLLTRHSCQVASRQRLRVTNGQQRWPAHELVLLCACILALLAEFSAIRSFNPASKSCAGICQVMCSHGFNRLGLTAQQYEKSKTGLAPAVYCAGLLPVGPEDHTTEMTIRVRPDWQLPALGTAQEPARDPAPTEHGNQGNIWLAAACTEHCTGACQDSCAISAALLVAHMCHR